MPDKRNMYQIALEVQNASNLSGVLISWSNLRDQIWEDVRANGGDFNRHPVNVLFASKVNSLTGSEQLFSDAYDKANRTANEMATG